MNCCRRSEWILCRRLWQQNWQPQRQRLRWRSENRDDEGSNPEVANEQRMRRRHRAPSPMWARRVADYCMMILAVWEKRPRWMAIGCAGRAGWFPSAASAKRKEWSEKKTA